MVATLKQISEEVGLTVRQLTRLCHRGSEILQDDPEAHSTYDYIIGELTSAGWIISNDEFKMFIDARRETSQ